MILLHELSSTSISSNLRFLHNSLLQRSQFTSNFVFSHFSGSNSDIRRDWIFVRSVPWLLAAIAARSYLYNLRFFFFFCQASIILQMFSFEYFYSRESQLYANFSGRGYSFRGISFRLYLFSVPLSWWALMCTFASVQLSIM